jgi:hypothetical protein
MRKRLIGGMYLVVMAAFLSACAVHAGLDVEMVNPWNRKQSTDTVRTQIAADVALINSMGTPELAVAALVLANVSLTDAHARIDAAMAAKGK